MQCSNLIKEIKLFDNYKVRIHVVNPLSAKVCHMHKLNF